MCKKISLLFLFLLLFIINIPSVFAFPNVEIPNLVKTGTYNQVDGELYLEEVEIDESIYTDEELSVAQGLEDVLAYLDASLYIEANSSTIIAGKKVICDDITGELEEVTSVYSTNLLVNKVIAYALTKEGCPYSQAFREAYDIFDCSSFVRRMYQEYSGVYIGNNSSDIADKLWRYQVPMSEIEPGDLLYKPGHIVLYIGNGQVIHAAGVKSGVIISSMYYTRFTQAFRPIDYIKEIKGPSAAKSISW